MVKTVAIFAVKGGVGKTLTSINIARRLADHYKVKVGFIDADFDNANFSQFTNITDELKIVDSKEFQLYDWRGVQVFSMSLIAGRENSVSMTGDRYAQMIADVLKLSNWDVDIFVVDLPGGSSDIFRSVMQLFTGSIIGNILVAQPSMIDALYRAFNMHQHFQVPVLGVIENMAYFECPKCKETYKVFGDGKTLEVVNQFDSQILGKIPLSPRIAELMNDGEAILDDDYILAIDAACAKILESEPVETGLSEKMVSSVTKKLEEIVGKSIASIISLSNTDFDIASIRRETGFTERKVFRLIISDQAMSREITHVNLRMEDRGLRVIKHPSSIDFEVVVDFKTFSRIIMRKRKINGEYYKYNALNAWFNGDLKVFGEGHTPKALHAIREIFMNDAMMDRVVEKYGKMLEKFI